MSFAVEDTLSDMRCVIDPLPDQQQHGKVRTRLVDSLRERYGRPDDAPGDDHAFGKQRWKWQGKESTLTLVAEWNSAAAIIGKSLPNVGDSPLGGTEASTLELHNTWDEHDAVRNRIREELSQQQRAQEQAREQQERQQRKQEAEKLGGEPGSLVDDL